MDNLLQTALGFNRPRMNDDSLHYIAPPNPLRIASVAGDSANLAARGVLS